MYSCGPPHMDVQKQDDQHELTYSNYVRTQDVTLKTCRRRWMIGRSGERGSGISVLAARHDDDDDDELISSGSVENVTYKLRAYQSYIYHHHHVVPLERVSLILSRHFSLSFITSGWSSRLHLVSSHSCCMYVRAGRPASAQP